MLNDLYEISGSEVLKRTVENGSAWKESMTKKVPKTCCTADNSKERIKITIKTCLVQSLPMQD